MEEKMRKTIHDLDRRDKQLAANEQEVCILLICEPSFSLQHFDNWIKSFIRQKIL